LPIKQSKVKEQEIQILGKNGKMGVVRSQWVWSTK